MKCLSSDKPTPKRKEEYGECDENNQLLDEPDEILNYLFCILGINYISIVGSVFGSKIKRNQHVDQDKQKKCDFGSSW
jgi:hypothetical protein